MKINYLRFSILFYFLSFILLPAVAYTQPNCDKYWKSGPICGRVVDYDTGLPIGGAQIIGETGCSPSTTTSDGQGFYCIPLNCSGTAPAIRYNGLVTVKASGYCTIKTRPIFGRIDSVNFYLNRNCNCSRATDSLALTQMSNALNLNWPTTTPLDNSAWGGGSPAIFFSENICVAQINMKSGFGVVANGILPTSAFATLSGLQEFDSEGANGRFLSGTLPDMSNFKYLNYFRLRNSKMTGGIPASFGKLKNLTELIIGNNPQLGGVIPPELGNIRELGVLVLSDNGLTGSMPTALGDLKKLYEFYADRNILSGTLPTGFATSDSFHIFQIDSCLNLTGSATQIDYLFNKPKMRYLGLSHNTFSGKVAIPGNTVNPNLVFVNLNNNQFDSLGIIPSRNLFLLSAKNNKLTFDDIVPNMTYFNTTGQSGCIGGDKLSISGYAPQDSIFVDTTIIVTLGGPLSINLKIDGALTNNLYTWKRGSTSVSSDGLSNLNRFIRNTVTLSDTGTYTCQVTNPNAPLLTLYSRKIRVVINNVPSCRQADSLQLVALFNATNGANWRIKTNWLTSNPINTWYGITLNADGCTVKEIRLDNDSLRGTIPNLVLPNLQILDLSSNRLTGSIPNFVLPNLQELILRDNQLTGSIPNFNLPNLTKLTVSSNQLTGNVPNFNLPNLLQLSISSNQLTGNLPNFNLPKLTELLSSSNQLSGNIPNFNLPKLQFLYLNTNQFNGNIPNFSLPQLTILSLNNNQLSGCIPQSIKMNCPLITATGGNISSNPLLSTQNWANYWNNNEGVCLFCASVTAAITGTTTVCTGSTTTITTNTNAVLPTYLWSTGATTASINVSATGTYTVTVSQSDGCTKTATATVTSSAITPSVSIATNTPTICSGSVANFTLTPTNGGTTPSYIWKKNGVQVGTGTTYTAQGLANNDTITCEMTSNAACVSPTKIVSNSLKMTVNSSPVPNLVPTQPTCGQTNGSITTNITGGKAPFSYLWSNGATTPSITNISAATSTTYVFTATDANGCIGSSSVQVACVPANCTNVSLSRNATICEGKTFALPKGGTATTAGTYRDTFKVGTCDSIIVTNLTVNPSVTKNVSANINQGQTYTLPSGVVVSAAGTYRSVLQQRVTGCDSIINTTLTVTTNQPCTASIGTGANRRLQIDSIACNGGTSPFVNFAFATGAQPMTYKIDTFTQVLNPVFASKIKAGQHTAVVIDGAGCRDTLIFTIGQPNQLALNAPTVVHPKCATDRTGRITFANLMGGSLPYTFTWSNGATGVSATNLLAGSYKVILTDNKGCKDSAQTTIAGSLVASTNTLTPSICSGQTYTLPNGQVVSPTINTTYRDTIRTLGGCDSLIRVVNLTIAPLTAPSVGTITQPTCTVSTGSFVLNGLPSTGTWTLTRNPGAVTITGATPSTNVVGLAAGTYTYTVKNAANCISPPSNPITINAAPTKLDTPSVGKRTPSICDSTTGIVVLNGLPSTGTWTLTRNPGSFTSTGTGTTTSVSGLAAGTYTFSVRTAVACPSANATAVMTCAANQEEACLGALLNTIPNGFTPGDNGTNDIFNPQKYLSLAGCSKNVEAAELHIMNRWGETIYKAVPYTQWDGKSASQQRTVPTGTYYYVLVLNLNGTRKSVKGVLNLFAD